MEGNQAVIYRGPWKKVEDDDDHVYRRGERTAVCEKTYRILTTEPYASQFVPVPSRVEIPEEGKRVFDCSRPARRHPRETKGAEFSMTAEGAAPGCEPEGCC